MPSIEINNEILTFNNIYYVDPVNGNDSTGIVNNPLYPYRTFDKAKLLGNLAGNAIYCKAGIYTFEPHIYGYSRYVCVDFYNLKCSVIGVPGKTIFTGHTTTNSWGGFIGFRPVTGVVLNIYNIIFKLDGDNAEPFISELYDGAYLSSQMVCNFYNCVFDAAGYTPCIEKKDFYKNRGTSNYINCSFIIGRPPTLHSNGGVLKFTNAAFDKTISIGARTTCLSNASYDIGYNIISSGWKNTGTGTNPDGTVAHIGVYGGIYAWAYDFYLVKDGSEIKTYQNGSWVNTGLFEPLTKADFKLYGMPSLPVDISSLSDTFEILAVSNETKKIQLTIDPFWPLEQLQNPELLIWTDDINMSSLMVSVTGKFKDIFRYKVEFEDTILKDWTEFTDQPVSDSVIVSSSIIQSLNPYTITVTAEQADGTIVTSSGTVTLYDTEPTLIVEMVGLDVHVQVGDAEGDDVQFLVRLNGTQLYPTEEGFTDLIPSPANWYKTLLSNEVNIGSGNIIEITAKDQWGKQSSITYNFVGEYVGIMFVECKEDDSEGDLYTTDLGELLKYLDFGILIAGQVSESIPVYLKNMTGKTITNIKFTSSNITLDSGVKVYIGDSNDVYGIEPTTITFTDVVQPEEKIKFHVRLHAYPTAKNPGVFEVLAIADTQ